MHIDWKSVKVYALGWAIALALMYPISWLYVTWFPEDYTLWQPDYSAEIQRNIDLVDTEIRGKVQDPDNT